MLRYAWLLPLSLGVFLACDGSDPSSPDSTANPAASEAAEDAAVVVIDVQPLGDLEKAVINLGTGKFTTVAVVDYPGFFDLVDLSTITFSGAPLMHPDQITQNPDCHMTTVYVDEVPVYEAHLLHFDLADLDTGVVNMCLSGSFLGGDSFESCVDVTVQSKGRGGGK